MRIKIEEAFNDCLERLSAGESLDSCLSDYPYHAAELDMMLRTAYDVRRRAYPIQPRPEFKYWAKVRLHGVQDYARRQPAETRPSPFNLRRNLAISMAALLVFVIASSGTVAASSDSLPDEPLYGVKMVAEQAQVTFAFSDVDKAEVYASLAEKRANEIVALARKGKTESMATTTARMNYQLDQAERFISQYEVANAGEESGESAVSTAPSAATSAPAQTILVPPGKSASGTDTQDGQQRNFNLTQRPPLAATRAATNLYRAKNTMNATTAKSLTALQNALEKAPDSAKPALLEVIQRTKKANERAQQQLNLNNSQHILPPNPATNALPALPTDKQHFVPPLNNNLRPVDPRPFNKPNLPNVLPPGSANNQTENSGENSDDDENNQYNNLDDGGTFNRENQTQPVTTPRLPIRVNPIIK